MKVLTAHVPLELAGKVDELSARLQRSRGWIVKQALADWVAKQDAVATPGGFAEAAHNFEYTTKAGDDPVIALKKLRETTTLGDVSWRELRDAGRR